MKTSYNPLRCTHYPIYRATKDEYTDLYNGAEKYYADFASVPSGDDSITEESLNWQKAFKSHPGGSGTHYHHSDKEWYATQIMGKMDKAYATSLQRTYMVPNIRYIEATKKYSAKLAKLADWLKRAEYEKAEYANRADAQLGYPEDNEPDRVKFDILQQLSDSMADLSKEIRKRKYPNEFAINRILTELILSTEKMLKSKISYEHQLDAMVEFMEISKELVNTLDPLGADTKLPSTMWLAKETFVQFYKLLVVQLEGTINAYCPNMYGHHLSPQQRYNVDIALAEVRRHMYDIEYVFDAEYDASITISQSHKRRKEIVKEVLMPLAQNLDEASVPMMDTLRILWELLQFEKLFAFIDDSDEGLTAEQKTSLILEIFNEDLEYGHDRPYFGTRRGHVHDDIKEYFDEIGNLRPEVAEHYINATKKLDEIINRLMNGELQYTEYEFAQRLVDARRKIKFETGR